MAACFDLRFDSTGLPASSSPRWLQDTEIESTHKCFGQKDPRLASVARRPKTRKRGAHHGGASTERQFRSQGPSQQSRQGAQLRLVHVHPCCRLQPGRLSPETQAQVTMIVRLDRRRILPSSQHLFHCGEAVPSCGRLSLSVPHVFPSSSCPRLLATCGWRHLVLQVQL